MVQRVALATTGFLSLEEYNMLQKQGRKQVANFGGAWKDENSNFKGEIFHSTSKSTVPTKLIFLNSPNIIVLFSL